VFVVRGNEFTEPLLRNGGLFIRLSHSNGCARCLFLRSLPSNRSIRHNILCNVGYNRTANKQELGGILYCPNLRQYSSIRLEIGLKDISGNIQLGQVEGLTRKTLDSGTHCNRQRYRYTKPSGEIQDEHRCNNHVMANITLMFHVYIVPRYCHCCVFRASEDHKQTIQ
jgi:hypothetical protein